MTSFNKCEKITLIYRNVEIYFDEIFQEILRENFQILYKGELDHLSSFIFPFNQRTHVKCANTISGISARIKKNQVFNFSTYHLIISFNFFFLRKFLNALWNFFLRFYLYTKLMRNFKILLEFFFIFFCNSRT